MTKMGKGGGTKILTLPNQSPKNNNNLNWQKTIVKDARVSAIRFVNQNRVAHNSIMDKTLWKVRSGPLIHRLAACCSTKRLRIIWSATITNFQRTAHSRMIHQNIHKMIFQINHFLDLSLLHLPLRAMMEQLSPNTLRIHSKTCNSYRLVKTDSSGRTDQDVSEKQNYCQATRDRTGRSVWIAVWEVHKPMNYSLRTLSNHRSCSKKSLWFKRMMVMWVSCISLIGRQMNISEVNSTPIWWKLIRMKPWSSIISTLFLNDSHNNLKQINSHLVVHLLANRLPLKSIDAAQIILLIHKLLLRFHRS